MTEYSPLRSRLYWAAGISLVALLTVLLIVLAPEPRANPVQVAPLSVPVTVVAPQTLRIPVRSRGHVQMAREYQISSRVSGRVTHISPALVSGGYVQAGELLLQLDAQRYELEVRQRQAELDTRLLQQAEIRAQASVAQQQAADNDFARFIPQLRMADSQADAAQAALIYAKQQLQDTRLFAPASGRIAQLQVQPGQNIQPAQTLATLYNDDWQEIALTVSDDEARLLQLNQQQADLTVQFISGDQRYQGQVLRTLARRGDFQQMIIIARPQYRDGEQPLLPGTWVEAEIFSPKLSQITVIPRSALQAGNRLLLVDAEQRLQPLDAHIIYRAEQVLYVNNPLADGTLLVNSSRRSLLPGRQVLPVVSDNATDNTADKTTGSAPMTVAGESL